MKKTHIFIIAFLFSVQFLFSQTDKEKALLDKMTSEICNEIDKAGFKDKDNAEEIKVKLGMAFLPVLQKNSEEIKKVFGWEITDPKGSEAIGEKLGAYAVYKCDKFRDIALQMMKKDKDMAERVSAKMEEKGNELSLPASENVNGKIDRIENNDFSIIYFSTNEGETIKLLWLEKFEGSELLSEDYANKKFNIQYTKKSIYQPKTKSYSDMKVITGLSVL
jgi:hypothetical protein